jgi:3-keto-disaccharide hydrolase
MHSRFLRFAAFSLLGFAATPASAQPDQGATAPAATSPAATSPAPAEGWQVLFDGKITRAFRGWHSKGFPAGWHVVDGTLAKEGAVDELITRKEYANFELELDWNIGESGNSGVFYRGTREYDHIYWSGPEYQLLDDANAPDGRSRLTAAASAYAIYPAPAGVVKPFGEWNTTRLVVKGTHVEHWLNGQLMVAYDLGSPDWQARVAASKFSKYPNYGLAKKGLIGIQGDHPGTLALRHIRIRELP